MNSSTQQQLVVLGNQQRRFSPTLIIPAIVVRKSLPNDNFDGSALAATSCENVNRKFPAIKRLDSSTKLCTRDCRRRSSTRGFPVTPTAVVPTPSDSSPETETMKNINFSPKIMRSNSSLCSKWLSVLLSKNGRSEQLKVATQQQVETDCRIRRSSTSGAGVMLIGQPDAEAESGSGNDDDASSASASEVDGLKSRSNSTPTIITPCNNAFYCYNNNSVSTFFESNLENNKFNKLFDDAALESSAGENVIATQSTTAPPVTTTTNFLHQLFGGTAVAQKPLKYFNKVHAQRSPVKTAVTHGNPGLPFDTTITPTTFLTRTDFFQLLKSHAGPRAVYQQSHQLKHTINRIRRDPLYYTAHCQDHREVVKFLNLFVVAAQNAGSIDVSASFPDGWHMKRHFDGRTMYCGRQNHRTITTFIDPRLAMLARGEEADTFFTAAEGRQAFLLQTRRARRQRRSRLLASSSANSSLLGNPGANAEPIEWLSLAQQQRLDRVLAETAAAAQPDASLQHPQVLASNMRNISLNYLSYEDRLIGFIRQPHALSVMARRYPDLLSDSTLQQYIRRVKRDGRAALRNLSYSIRFAMLISACGHDIENFQQQHTGVSSAPSILASYHTSTAPPQQQPHLPPSEFSLLCRMLTTANQHHHRHHHRHTHTHARTRHHSVYTATRAEESREKATKLKNVTSFLPLVNSKPLTFAEKVKLLQRNLRRKSRGHSSLQKVKLTIKRETCLQDAFDKIMRLSRRELAHACLYVRFENESGLDYGGPLREFFALLSSEVFDPYYGLFEFVGGGQNPYAVQINPHSDFVEDSMKWFRFAGRVLALALLHGCLIDVRFTPFFYEALLNSEKLLNKNNKLSPTKSTASAHTLAQLAQIDPGLHRSLSWLAENPIPDSMRCDLCFSMDQDICGVVEEIDLIPHGSYQPVTDDNKAQYIQLMVQYRCEQRSVGKQMQAVVSGFREVLGNEIYQLLCTLFSSRVDEFEMLLCGAPAARAIHVQDWRENTEYRGGYDSNSVAVKMFWNVVTHCFTETQRLQLLVFVTGTAALPYDGFGSLRGSSGGLQRFTIEKWDNGVGGGNVNSKLPRAHTCFNRLDLPAFSDEIVMCKKLLMAIEETEAFGIE